MGTETGGWQVSVSTFRLDTLPHLGDIEGAATRGGVPHVTYTRSASRAHRMTEHKSTTSETPRQGNTVADWQPIETAPLAPHERPLLLWVPGQGVGLGFRVTRSFAAGWYWTGQDPYEVSDIHPAHWAYPPPPPATEGL